MSYRRSDQIYERLEVLRGDLACLDGSKTMGFVTPAMEIDAEEIRDKIRALEAEQTEIKEGKLENPRI